MQDWKAQFSKDILEKAKDIVYRENYKILSRTEKVIKVTTFGKSTHEVTIIMKDGETSSMRCNCPKGRARILCEHIAAAMYACFTEEAQRKSEEEQKKEELLRLAELAAKARKEEEAKKLEEEQREKERLEQEAEERRKEVAKKIAERKEQKAKERAARKRKRQQDELLEKIRQEEALKKQQEEEARKQEEAVARETRRQEELLKKRQEEEAARQEQKRKREEKRKRAMEKQTKLERIKNIHEQEQEYCYFDFDKIRKSCGLSDDNLLQGDKMINAGELKIAEMSSGYYGDNAGIMFHIRTEALNKYRGTVYTRVILSKDDLYNADCTCQNCRGNYYLWNEKRNCQYIAAAIQLAERNIRMQGIGDATDLTGALLLRSYQKKKSRSIIADVEKQEDTVHLEPRIVERDGDLELSFKVGNKRMYVIKDLNAFIKAVNHCETLNYGKNFSFNHQIDNFTESSKKWIPMIEKAVQEEIRIEERASDRYWRSGGENLVIPNFELYGWRLDALHENLADNGIIYERRSYDGTVKNTLYPKKRQIQLQMQITRSGTAGKRGFEGIRVTAEIPDLHKGERNAYIMQDGEFVQLDEGFLQKTEFLFEQAQNGVLEFQVGRNHLADFYYNFLPVFSDVVEIEEKDQEEIHSFLPPEVSFIFYLDNQNGNVTCQIGARYGEVEYEVLDLLNPIKANTINSRRMLHNEEELLVQIQGYFSEYDATKAFLYCSGEDEVFRFLTEGVKQLAALGEVRATNAFKRLRVVKKTPVSVGVSVSQGMLDLEVASSEYSKQELLEILGGYKTKKKYFRLKNGDFVNLEDQNLMLLREMMEGMQLSPKEFIKDHIKVPAYRTIYMDKLLEEHEGVYSVRDKNVKKLLKDFKTVKDSDFEEPQSLSHIMRGYQKTGFKWMKMLEGMGFGGILADDMGLGKTLQTIALLLSYKETETQTQGTSLIVAPASLVYNWKEEIQRFAPQLKAETITGTQEERRQKIDAYKECDVIITSYDLLKRDIMFYEEKQFQYQVLDEAQYIKNHNTAVAKAVKVIQSRNRFALTGTPIENRLSELWSIFDYLMPGFLYKYDQFRKELELPIAKNQDEAATGRLQKLAAPFVLRRLKGDVLKDLPDKLEETRYVLLNSEQKTLYEAQAAHMQQSLAKQSGEDFAKNKLKILAELTRLRQICCDPNLCYDNYKGESGKLESCIELLESAIDSDHKILLFSQFTSMLAILEERLKKANISFYKITGETSKEQRLRLVKQFNENDTSVFLISLKAGGVGLNLTGADVVVHYDPWWNVAAQNQATDRAHRIGQEKNVTVYKLIAKNTVEEKILKLQEIKKDLADKVLSGEQSALGSMSKEDLLELLNV